MAELMKNEEGKYCWYYELNLYKNMTFRNLLIKLMTFIFLGIWLLTTIVSIVRMGFDMDWFLESIWVFALMIIGMDVIAIISYYIVAKMNRGFYRYVYEMDENRIFYQETEETKENSKAVAAGAIAAGLARGNLGSVGLGLHTLGTKGAYSISFETAKITKVDPRNHFIQIRDGLMLHHVYADPAYFQEIHEFIQNHTAR